MKFESKVSPTAWFRWLVSTNTLNGLIEAINGFTYESAGCWKAIWMKWFGNSLCNDSINRTLQLLHSIHLFHWSPQINNEIMNCSVDSPVTPTMSPITSICFIFVLNYVACCIHALAPLSTKMRWQSIAVMIDANPYLFSSYFSISWNSIHTIQLKSIRITIIHSICLLFALCILFSIFIYLFRRLINKIS